MNYSNSNPPVPLDVVVPATAAGVFVVLATRLSSTRKSVRQVQSTLNRLEESASQQAKGIQQIHSGQGSLQSSLQNSVKHEIQSQSLAIDKALIPVAMAQTKIKRGVDSIKSIFDAPKLRGPFGEKHLENILKSHFLPDEFRLQHSLSNNKRVDCVVLYPSPIGMVSIDSKFPELRDGKKRNAKVQKGHIDTIAKKYIIPGETADFAFMFLPSDVHLLHATVELNNVLMHANRKKVYIVSPSTLTPVLNILKLISQKFALHNGVEDVLSNVEAISNNVRLLEERYKSAEKSLEKSKEELGKMGTSMRKIRKQKIALDEPGSLPKDKK